MSLSDKFKDEKSIVSAPIVTICFTSFSLEFEGTKSIANVSPGPNIGGLDIKSESFILSCGVIYYNSFLSLSRTLYI